MFEKLLLGGRKVVFVLLVLLALGFILGPIIWLLLCSFFTQSQLVSMGRDFEAADPR
jgi:hypothetical protein